jgi:hypothetical protein
LKIGAIPYIESGLLQEPRIDARFARDLLKLLKRHCVRIFATRFRLQLRSSFEQLRRLSFREDSFLSRHY